MFKTVKWYVYGLTDPFTGEIRYVGMTKDLKKRMNRYNGYRGNCKEMTDWLLHIGAKGRHPEVKILEETESYSRAKKSEKSWIVKEMEKRGRLFNKVKLPDDWYG